MKQKGHILSAGMATLSSLSGMALIVQAAGVRNPPVHPITGIFFLVVGLTLVVGLAGLVWFTLRDEDRAINLFWFASGGSLGCGVTAFYSVGLFFLIAALNWGIVASTVADPHKRPTRNGLFLALVVAGLFLLILGFVRNVQSA